ncbi:hypothetical protein KSP39_PZI010460 [Platanthera zijinensis]|uniref:Uncharacterized protein n=1 Tax=Platanthera zijinensis TaxID=2320716 RepID=A0AAP0G6E6_9ASPA
MSSYWDPSTPSSSVLVRHGRDLPGNPKDLLSLKSRHWRSIPLQPRHRPLRPSGWRRAIQIARRASNFTMTMEWALFAPSSAQHVGVSYGVRVRAAS